jgi:glycosyltransferase involved in cell wall biosynthesis
MPAKHLPALAIDGLDATVGDDDSFSMPNHRGAAIFQLAADKTRAFFTEQLQAAGHRVLVETDDNYLADSAKRYRKKANWGLSIGESPHTVQGHKWIVEHADGVIVTTDYLASQYRKLNPHVYVCPNQVDPDDWQPLAKPDDGVLRIGWFASASHAGDEVLIRRAMEWASRQKDVEVVTLGYTPQWKFPFQALPWATDLSAYRRAAQFLDVGLAPVIPTPFTRGRSDLKWLEMSMGGAATVVSDTDPYNTVPDDLTIKATDAAGFYRAVRRLVQNRDEVKQLAAAAREHVLKERTITANLWRWEEAIHG